MQNNSKSQIGVIGMGIMGANLARNFASKKIKTSIYNRTYEKTLGVIDNYGNDYLAGYESLRQFLDSLDKPKKIILMVAAGVAVDEVIDSLAPFLEKDDIVIDAGNSHYKDTIRRCQTNSSFKFMGMGVSGGEEGALNGPSIMPGCNEKTWQILKDLLEPISARDFNGGPCVSWISEDGAGHYVKMVHNGIEYAIMQLLAETYDLLSRGYGLRNNEIAEVFEKLNTGLLKSFLLDISIPVILKKDELTSDFLLKFIKDKAGQKGTGTWTSIEGLERGVPINSIYEAVSARSLSVLKDLRTQLSVVGHVKTVNRKELSISDLESALLAGMVLIFSQGFHLITEAAAENKWSIKLFELCRIWQGGCIIRCNLLGLFFDILKNNIYTKHLLERKELMDIVEDNYQGLSRICVKAIDSNIPFPCFLSLLSYYNSLVSSVLPANFIQGLRDFFGAHTYERNDKDGVFHTVWDG